jgi:DNA-binding CsgD family transcriptional regulator
VPICGAAHDIFTHAAAILVATPVVPQDVPSADVVQGLFDLTPSEAKLAALIAAGHPPREASLKLGVAEETARTTLKRVLAKTGLHRQADLVGLLRGASLGQPRPAEPHAD